MIHRITIKQIYHGGTVMRDSKPDQAWSWWYLLLLAEFVPAMWVSLYNFAEPSWIGLPFFYWFQLLLVVICAIVTAIVYFATESSRQQ
jgi:hypothetical protein